MGKTRFHGWSVLLGCFLFLFFGSSLVANTVGLFMTPICAELNINTASFSLLYTFSAVSIAATMFLWVPKLHTGNIKRLLIFALIFMAGGYALYGFCTRAWHFWLTAAIHGVGLAFLMTLPVSLMITNWFAENTRPLAMSIAMSASGLGGITWTIILTRFINLYGWRMTYFLGASISFVSVLLIIIFFLKKRPEDYGQQPYERASSKSNGNAAPSQKWEGISKSTARKYPVFYIYLVRQLCIGLYMSGVITHVVNYLVTYSWEYTQASSVLSFFQVSNMVGLIIGGLIIGQIGLKKSIIIFGCLLVLSSAALIFAFKAMPLAYIYALLSGLSASMGTVVPSILPSEVFGIKDYTSIYSSGMTLNMIGSAIGTSGLALIANALGYPVSFAIITCICIMVVSFDVYIVNYAKVLRNSVQNSLAEQLSQTT